jgi:hypothetical protein
MSNGPRTAGKITVDMGYGRVNFPTSATTFACMKVTPDWERVSGANSGKEVPGSKRWTNAGSSGSYGGITHKRVEHSVGTILLFQVTKTLNGIAAADAAIFVRLRETGPLLEIYGKLPTVAQNAIGDEVTLGTLRGDLLNLSDLKLLGIEVPGNFRSRFMKADELRELISVVELQQEIAKRPTLVVTATDKGNIVQEVAATPGRRMRFRKG